ncbi:fungal zn(2)-cys(6) binuclear cluster domain protein, putative [Rhizoctonia solani AG-3 Rhs1AP]|uniref:Fungal zn(2)-cys(6) binuclear cluster domain protein, putative n=1 Tax=Rhizoctonia solani AG-3 Rhs1AP TaxID=1086054 RepID=X8IWB4_9AGAM|nr:fungal zn(2)-cys(6) binuclear cluster domain protein, putative [Rhizoctonia solani AG-3 Rhs1AP]
MTRFVFNPTRILPSLVNHIRRGYSFGGDSRQTMLLISNSVLAIAVSTDYDLTHFNTLYKLLASRVVDARARGDSELTRELALGVMEHSHQFMSALFKVGSLANVLNVMELYAPVFRRACPESNEELVNLPRRLTAMEIQLKYYAALDVLQSVITHRPMFFRYDLELLSHQEEMFIKLGNGPGLGWLYGISDRLMIALARINTLFEDFGNCVDPEVVQELEEEIAACEPIIYTSAEMDPTLNIGRIMVQEAWRLAANIYLYMALCGADSADARVVKIQKNGMKLLRSIKPRRNPDSFVVLPILVVSPLHCSPHVILPSQFGVATASPAGQSTLLSRLSGVSECSKPGTVGNDILRMLSDIWARTVERPAVWSDLRTACLRITGM